MVRIANCRAGRARVPDGLEAPEAASGRALAGGGGEWNEGRAETTYDDVHTMDIPDSYLRIEELLAPVAEIGDGGAQVRVTELMREVLYHALLEAKYELEVLPRNRDGALLGLYAVMDDLQAAIRHAESLDRPQKLRQLGFAGSR
jgi:hypothetical protein